MVRRFTSFDSRFGHARLGTGACGKSRPVVSATGRDAGKDAPAGRIRSRPRGVHFTPWGAGHVVPHLRHGVGSRPTVRHVSFRHQAKKNRSKTVMARDSPSA